MRRKKILLPVILSVFVISLIFSLHAENEDKTFFGNFKFGYRIVDTSGADFKYKEDINLDDGVRLFNFSLHYTPSEKFKKLLLRPPLPDVFLHRRDRRCNCLNRWLNGAST